MDAFPGWLGTVDQVMHFLRTVGADRDEAGAFLLGGAECPCFGLGGVDVVVPPSTVYFVAGRACGLASGLRGTSYGIGVTVI